MVVNEEHEFEELFNEASIFLSKYEKKDIELCLEAISKDFNVTIKNGKLLSKEWGESSFIYEQILKIVMKHLFSGEFNSDGFTKAIKFYHAHFKNYVHRSPTVGTMVEFLLNKNK